MNPSVMRHRSEVIAELRAVVRGEVIDSDHEVYDDVRTVFYRSCDRRPAAVVRVADAGDVARVAGPWPASPPTPPRSPTAVSAPC